MIESAFKSAPSAWAERLRSLLIALAASAAVIAVAFGDRLGDYLGILGRLDIRLKAPEFWRISATDPVIQVHLFGAVTALAIGVVLLIGVKGTVVHRTLGWGWVVAMATTAVSSVFIRELNQGSLSFIHLLTGWTVVVLPMAVYMARRKVLAHKRMMTGLFVGGVIVAGLFAFLPGRLLFNVFFAA